MEFLMCKSSCTVVLFWIMHPTKLVECVIKKRYAIFFHVQNTVKEPWGNWSRLNVIATTGGRVNITDSTAHTYYKKKDLLKHKKTIV